MKKFLITSVLSVLFVNSVCFASENRRFAANSEGLSEATVNQLVAAIERVENSKKYPFGIKSIPIKGNTEKERHEYARRICRNTVVNNYSRWVKAGKPGSYLDYLAGRYCPKSADREGNLNWERNIRKISGLDF